MVYKIVNGKLMRSVTFGYWKECEIVPYAYYCSVCGKGFTDYLTSYCSDCGARMFEVPLIKK